MVVNVGRVCLGGTLCWWALQAMHWYRSLPRLSDARLCGNCYLAAVGVPYVCGWFGAILILQVFSAEARRITEGRLIAFTVMLLGVAGMPDFLAYVAAVLSLIWLVASLLRGYTSAIFRTGR